MVCVPVRRDNPRAHLTCTTITSVDLAHYGVSGAKDWVSVDCGTTILMITYLRQKSCQELDFLCCAYCLRLRFSCAQFGDTTCNRVK